MSRTVEDRPLGGSDAESAAAEATAAESGARPALEVRLRANLVTDAPVPTLLPVLLRHAPAGDRHTVSIELPVPGPGGPGEARPAWAFPRALLEAGLRAPTEQGDVRIWPCGRVQVVLELHAEQGVLLLQLDSAPLVRFLRRTYA
ncbi:SsgA family sporulation/cell division regulator [Streptomyces sp. NBC_00237]|uniref:SsgA family sporulation/cell division regulator n=1 Tax=Streptomyces sp. NBC_00237 TaxID=2975687 RepID=UPI0022587D71|nr:SsgA family sporulation/cell division regulator [Streptomyces sp. NBC_00237]MCX5200685.1 SsgA family sporulation/cell division regulator [Streptomyces sp. NBC_00237]